MLYREAGQYKTSYAADMAIFPIRQDRLTLGVLLAIAFIGVPLLSYFHIWPFGQDYLLRAILLPFLILALAAIGVNILVGYCGQISLGSGAFMAIGAYSAYKLGTGVHIPLAWLGFDIAIPALPVLVSILLGGFVSAFVGILFGIPSLRIKGLYLAVATLAAQFFFDWVFLRVPWFTNYAPSGSVNAPRLNFFGWMATGVIFMAVAHIGREYIKEGSLKALDSLLYDGLMKNLDATMFSIIAFYIVSAAYRAFRIRSLEATILLAAAALVMLGNVPIGQALTNWIPNGKTDVLANLRIENIGQWILKRASSPATMAIDFGLGVGGLATALRLWLSLERGSYFEEEL